MAEPSIQTLVYLMNEREELLLGKKKRKLGAGRWMGYGGKLDPSDRSIIACGQRELFEESGIRASTLDWRGLIEYRWRGRPEIVNMVHVLFGLAGGGEPHDTAEMLPRWFRTDALPWEEMWSSDSLWLPQMLRGATMTMRVLYDDQDRVVRFSSLGTFLPLH